MQTRGKARALFLLGGAALLRSLEILCACSHGEAEVLSSVGMHPSFRSILALHPSTPSKHSILALHPSTPSKHGVGSSVFFTLFLLLLLFLRFYFYYF